MLSPVCPLVMFPFNRPLSFVLSTIPYYVLGARELLRRRQSHICPGKRVHKKTQTIKGRQVTGGQVRGFWGCGYQLRGEQGLLG